MDLRRRGLYYYYVAKSKAQEILSLADRFENKLYSKLRRDRCTKDNSVILLTFISKSVITKFHPNHDTFDLNQRNIKCYLPNLILTCIEHADDTTLKILSKETLVALSKDHCLFDNLRKVKCNCLDLDIIYIKVDTKNHRHSTVLTEDIDEKVHFHVHQGRNSVRNLQNQRTNGPVNANLISEPAVSTKPSFAEFDIVLKWVKVNSGSSSVLEGF